LGKFSIVDSKPHREADERTRRVEDCTLFDLVLVVTFVVKFFLWFGYGSGARNSLRLLLFASPCWPFAAPAAVFARAPSVLSQAALGD
jgi:hypothetical protein